VSLLFSPSYESANVKVFENPSDPANSILYFLAIIAFTIFILILAKKSERVLRIVMYSILILSAFYVFYPFFRIFSIFPSIVVLILLLKKPNNLTINVSAFLLACGVTAMFGISLEPFPVLILLIILAVYDFVAVYSTKHMIDLAENVIKLKLPLLFVIPIKNDKPMMLGVGDVVIPNILTVSAQTFINSPTLLGVKIPALTTLIGGTLGLSALLIFAEKFKRAHAGLPFINIGAILGFLIGCMMT